VASGPSKGWPATALAGVPLPLRAASWTVAVPRAMPLAVSLSLTVTLRRKGKKGETLSSA
jgi:hypothetical protein